MTDPATTIREALTKVRGYRRDVYGLFPITDAEVDAILAALTELEQQLADREVWKRENESYLDRAEAAERERDQLDALLNESIRDHQKTAQERDQLADTLRAIANPDGAYAVGDMTFTRIPPQELARAALDRQKP